MWGWQISLCVRLQPGREGCDSLTPLFYFLFWGSFLNKKFVEVYVEIKQVEEKDLREFLDIEWKKYNEKYTNIVYNKSFGFKYLNIVNPFI